MKLMRRLRSTWAHGGVNLSPQWVYSAAVSTSIVALVLGILLSLMVL